MHDPQKKKFHARTRALAFASIVLAMTPVVTFAAEGASGGGGGGALNYAKQFMVTDNALGTGLIWFCFVGSIGIVAVIIQNALLNRLSVYMPDDYVQTLTRLLDEKNYREAIELSAGHSSPFARAMNAALAQAARGYAAMEVALEETIDAISARRIRNLIWLEIAGAVGPMIGLFGTVFGMILAFNHLVAAGGTPKANELAGGIATALVCTFWGLVVGIPGVVAASMFRVRIEGMTAEGIHKGKELLAQFRPGAAKKPAAAAPAAAPAKPA
jgi:biopolymer transport protein ExbB